MEDEFILNKSTYKWSARLFSRLEKLLGINLKLHEEQNSAEEGDIFLFNHFARFETFIPQYLIYKKTGAVCRSIASSEFFKGDDTFTNYLIKLGGVPNNRPELLPFLAKEILRGRKIVLFPEGGMVKDRSVVDEKGQYSVYSRKAKQRRKHHTGAALLALSLENFKTRIKLAEEQNDLVQLENWKNSLGLESVEALLLAAKKPTNIVPANITFYPIRVDDNLLLKSIELINRKKLSLRATEEIIIESNLVMKNTDMDIRLGSPICPTEIWHCWDRASLSFINKHLINIEDYFDHNSISNHLISRIANHISKRNVGDLRDRYMESMYLLTTINLSHLASVAILKLIEKGRTSIDQQKFYKLLYLCIKNAQAEESIFLHRSLRVSTSYENVIDGKSSKIMTFINTASLSGLIKKENGQFIFTDQITNENEFDQIRLRNIIAVYANEATPIKGVKTAVDNAITETETISSKTWAKYRFDDELVSYDFNKKQYAKPKHEEINKQQTATKSGEPYFFLPDKHCKLGVVLVHGFLASPAELKDFALRLHEKGFSVIGVRMAGHGTSPWDLKDRNWQEWVTSIKRNYEILSPFCDKICVIGFSTGATASLLFAADKPKNLAGVVAVSTPVKFGNKNIVFVPLVHGLNKLISLVKSSENTNPFSLNNSDHPEINYRHIPVEALYELRLMIDSMTKRLPEIKCPILILHAEKDAVADISGVKIIEKNISSDQLSVIKIASDRHGLILEDIGDSQTHIMAFLTRLVETDQNCHKSESVISA
ncbi:MAG: alpha/beta fold hydrolase [Gammaproteobacteria bacterium]